MLTGLLGPSTGAARVAGYDIVAQPLEAKARPLDTLGREHQHVLTVPLWPPITEGHCQDGEYQGQGDQVACVGQWNAKPAEYQRHQAQG